MNFVCQICGVEKPTRLSLASHIGRQHKEHTCETYALEFKTDECLTCEFCNKEFYKKQTLQRRRKLTSTDHQCCHECFSGKRSEITKVVMRERRKSGELFIANRKAADTMKKNGHWSEERIAKRAQKSSEVLKPMAKEIARKAAITRAKDPEKYRAIYKEMMRKRRESGYYETNKEKISMSREKGIKTRRENGTLSESAKKAARVKKENGYYESEAFKNAKQKSHETITRKLMENPNYYKEYVAKTLVHPNYLHRNGKFRRGSYFSYKTGELNYFESSYEYVRMCQLDNNPMVKYWRKNTNTLMIPYNRNGISKVTIPDFLIIENNNSLCIEETKGHINNDDWNKINITKKFCDEMGIQFVVLKEKDILKNCHWINFHKNFMKESSNWDRENNNVQTI
jgi:hypothetical protein